MDKLIPSFKKSLFEGSKVIIEDLTEFGIDRLLDDGLFKDISIVNILVGIKNTYQNIHDRNLLRQTLQFIKEFNSGNIERYKLKKYKEKIYNDPVKEEEEFSRILILLNNTIELDKSSMLANLFRNYINEKINWNEFCEFSEIIRMMFLNDIKTLEKIYTGQMKDTTGEKLYPVDRLTSLGLVNVSMKSLSISSHSNSRNDKYVNLTAIGEKFYQLIINN